MIDIQDFYGQALEQLAAKKESNPDLADMLGFFENILALQLEAAEIYHPDPDGLAPGPSGDRLTEGLSLLDLEALQIDWPLFERLFSNLYAALGLDRDPPDICAMDAAWHLRLLTALMKDAALFDGCAEELGIPSALLIYLSYAALAPFMGKMAASIADDLDLSLWRRGLCPVCGSEPLIAKLEGEGGKRFLLCHLCATEWLFKRLECPFCGERNQAQLHIIAAELEPLHHISVCDTCHTYIKVVDMRKGDPELSLYAENLGTIHLDLAAAKRGFHRDTTKLFGLFEGRLHGAAHAEA